MLAAKHAAYVKYKGCEIFVTVEVSCTCRVAVKKVIKRDKNMPSAPPA